IFLYQDGVLIAADTSSNIFTIDDIVSNLDIGVAQDGTGNYAYNFLGKVDELRIWNTLKFQLNILQGRFRSYDFDEPNLVGCWRLDNEGSATTALDRSANQNYATLHNGPTWSLTDAAPISMDNIEQLVDISWTCADNKIVITPNTPLKYLENSTFLATIIDAK